MKTYLDSINWVDSWGEDFNKIERVSEISKITKGAVLELCSLFPPAKCWEIIRRCVPENFLFSDFWFLKQVEKVKACLPKQTEALKHYKETPFFNFGESPWKFKNTKSVLVQKQVEKHLLMGAKRPKLMLTKSTQFQQKCESCLKLKAELKLLQQENEKLKQEFKEKLDEIETKHKKLQKSFGGKCSALKYFTKKNNLSKRKGKSDCILLNDLAICEAPPPKVPKPRFDERYDYVRILNRDKNNPKIFEGVKCIGTLSEEKKSGTKSIFANLHTLKCNSAISSRQLNNRVDFVWKLLEIISNSSKKEEIVLLLTKFFKKYSGPCLKSATNAGFLMRQKLSVTEAVNLQSLIRLPNSAIRRLRTFLNNIGLNIFPSENSMRAKQQNLINHVSKEMLSVKVESLVSCGKDNDKNIMQSIPVLRVPDLIGFVRRIVSELLSNSQLDLGGNFDNKIWLNFGGDRGGNLMKFHFEVINSHLSGSIYNLHLFAMYEASECYENIATVLLPFVSDLREMQNTSFEIEGYNILLFLSGDFKFLDTIMGHQGSSASHPSLKDRVTLSHLQNHGGRPHSPSHCKIDLRTIDDFELSYNENLAENIGVEGGDLSKTGKHHGSVTRRCLFPLTNLNQIVPPVLHITLGIVLKLFNILQDTAKNYDSDVSCGTRLVSHEKEWIAASEKLLELENLLTKSGSIFIDFLSLKDRISAISEGNLAKLNEIAQGSDNVKKRPSKKEVEKCDGSICCITKYDMNMNLIECDRCSNWFHYLCEGIFEFDDGEALTYKFVCSSCSGESVLDVLECKIDSLREHQIQLEEEIRNLSLECDKLHDKMEEEMGPREQKLLKALDDIKVDRKAYHDNVFVGNHCKIILKNYKTLLSCVSDKPVYKYFDELFGLYAQINPLISTKRFLTEEEISSVSEMCTRFTEILPVYFPHVNLTRKMHELAFDVPRFLAKHKTVGYLSEQEGESLHNSVTQEVRQLSSVRDAKQKLQLIMQRQELRGLADRSLLTPNKRKCSKCFAFFAKGLCKCPAEK